MALVVPDEGEIELLSHMLNKSAATDVKLRLYTAITGTLDEDTVIGDFTECAASGYAAITLTGASWTVGIVSGNLVQASYAEQSFTMTATTTVVGYYVTNNSGSKVLWAEAFSGGSYTLPSGGGTIAVTPKITLS